MNRVRATTKIVMIGLVLIAGVVVCEARARFSFGIRDMSKEFDESLICGVEIFDPNTTIGDLKNWLSILGDFHGMAEGPSSSNSDKDEKKSDNLQEKSNDMVSGNRTQVQFGFERRKGNLTTRKLLPSQFYFRIDGGVKFVTDHTKLKSMFGGDSVSGSMRLYIHYGTPDCQIKHTYNADVRGIPGILGLALIDAAGGLFNTARATVSDSRCEKLTDEQIDEMGDKILKMYRLYEKLSASKEMTFAGFKESVLKLMGNYKHKTHRNNIIKYVIGKMNTFDGRVKFYNAFQSVFEEVGSSNR